ncbi:MAG TPA: hypothetical protein VIM73_22820 [Polyangiaceae bacterium]
METRFNPPIAGALSAETSWAAEPESACRTPDGTHGAPSAPASRGDTGTGGASGTADVQHERAYEDEPSCTFTVLGALADCATAAATRGRGPTAVCIASSGAAVECLVQKFAKK